MKISLGISAAGVALMCVLLLSAAGQEEGGSSGRQESVGVRAGIDHTEWERLLRQYVDAYGLVDYQAWKSSADDLEALSRYLRQFASEPHPPAQGSERAASLINVYNAFAIHGILENYPTLSIRSLDESFEAARHAVGGDMVSLDDIEHGTLRPLLGYRVHATLVCAARSCPPLAREGYRADRLDAQLDRAMLLWLARDDLNRYLPIENRAEISSLFQWFAEDFEQAGGVRTVLQMHAPELVTAHLGQGYRTTRGGEVRGKREGAEV